MRTKWTMVVSTVVVLGLLLAGPAAAHRRSVVGSVAITIGGDVPTSAQLVGFALTANPGFEKLIVQPLHVPFAMPVFIEEDWSDDDDEDDSAATRSPRRRLLQRHLDTTLVLTNPSGTGVVLDLTLYDAAGEELGTDSVHLSGHQTKVLPVSNLLP